MDKLTGGELSNKMPVGDLVRWDQMLKDLLKGKPMKGRRKEKREGRREGGRKQEKDMFK